MSDKVKIDKVKPEGSAGDDLKHYYFQQDDDGLNMYSPTGYGPVNETPIIFGTSFDVRTESGATFTVNAKGITGTWVNPDDVGDPGDGTFQAQAGGTGEEEPTSSASAYA